MHFYKFQYSIRNNEKYGNIVEKGVAIIQHQTEIVTRYCESDALGHINNVSYFIYLEQARVEFILDNEIVPNLENWSFVLVSTHCDYKQQIYINERIVINTYLKEIGRSSFTLVHEFVHKERGDLLAYGEAVLVHFDFEKQKSSPIPDAIRTKMEKLLRR
ncbi:acyl-CoA thioesterase [Neobacillus niacini]|uniref:acyl-CoA thioesterase n=1 Tax=Neobacillus niacini TaxID=86668 RepID=UPI0039834CAF